MIDDTVDILNDIIEKRIFQQFTLVCFRYIINRKGDIMREKILKDIIEAMKSKDKDRLTTLRLLKGAMQLEEINKKGQLDDTEIINLISKQIKTRRESIVEFEKANRLDLVEKTEKEIEVLSTYMPEQLSEEEVIKLIDEAFTEIKPTSMKDMKDIMSYLNPKISGRADKSFVSKMIREKLS